MNKKILIAGVIALAVLASSMAIISEVDDGSVSAEIAGTNVAKIGSTEYPTLNAAVIAATSGETIELLKDTSGSGIGLFNTETGDGKIPAKSLIIDFGGHTYTVSSGAIGSGTEYMSQAFHLESDCGNFTLKNGTITSQSESGVKMLVQNYCNLTLQNITLDGRNLDVSNMDYYTLSNNSGTVSIETTTIYAKTGELGTKKAFAFDVDKTANVTVKSGTFYGNIAKTGTGTFEIQGGSFTDLCNAVRYAKAESTIVLADDASGPGIGLFNTETGDGKIPAKSLIIDFGGHTYTVSSGAIGSGTEYMSQAFHLESDCGNFTLKNGTITSQSESGVKMLVQNYCNLTLQNITLDGRNLDVSNMDYYTLSNNSGTVSIETTTIYAKTGELGTKKAFAFDVDKTANVTVKSGTFYGNIAKTGTGTFEIQGGSFTDLCNAVRYAKAESTIVLADDASGPGIGLFNTETGDGKIPAKSLIIDFGGHTYTVSSGAIGSGTEYMSQAFHLESDCGNFTLKNGTITSQSGSGVKMLVQNYCNLTLQNITLDGRNLDVSNMDYYTLSNNSGTVSIETTTIYAKTGELGTKKAFAFDVDKTANVTVKSGTFYGNIAKTGTGTFEIQGGSFTDLCNAVRYAKAESTIVLADDASGPGIGLFNTETGNGKIPAKSLIIDFGGHTYTVSSGAIGSGTEYMSQAFHLESDCGNFTLKNGTITSQSGSGVKMLVQNYCNLTLDDVILDGSNIGNGQYVLSNNCGVVSITGTTSITAPTDGFAFDACSTNHYSAGTQVTVDTTGTITGKVEFGVWGNVPNPVNTSLTINNGIFIGDLIVDSRLSDAAETKIIINGGSFTDATCILYMSNTARITINGDCTLSDNATVPAGAELSIASNKTLTVASGKTLIVNGTLVGDATGNISCPVSFNSNGGSSVSSTTSSYNGLVTQPTSPTKSGYNFAGWYKESGLINAWDFSTDVVSGGTVLYAKWTINQYTITIADGITVMDGETKIASNDLVAYDTVLTVTADPKTGHTSVLSASVGTIAEEGKYTVEGDVSFTIAHTAIQYTITIADGITVMDGETKIASNDLVAYDTVLTVTADPKTGHTSVLSASVGTIAEEGKYTVEGDVSFTIAHTAIQYTITIADGITVMDGETKIASNDLVAYDTVLTVTANPKTGHTSVLSASVGTIAEEGKYTVEGDVSFTIAHTAIQYTIVFNDGKTNVYSESLEYGTTITAPTAIPEKESTAKFDYVFSEWTGFKEGMTVTGDVTFEAAFTENTRSYTIVFNDGKTNVYSESLEYGTTITAPTAIPEKESTAKFDYVFSEWTGFKEGMTVTGDVTFEAAFTENTRSYTIVFNDGKTNVYSESLEYGTTITAPTAIPEKESTAKFDYVFSEWTGFKEGMTVTGDVTFEAAFTENTRSYTIVFNDGKTNVYSESLEYGTTITAPTAIPEKESTAKFDYVFSEWTGFKEGMTVTGDVTFEVAFTENTRSYTIVFNDGKTNVYSESLEYGTTITAPTAIPEKESTAKFDYVFSEWTGFKEGMTVTGDVTFEVAFTENTRSYTIVFNDGKTNVYSESLEYGTTITAPTAIPEKESTAKFDYVFSEWTGFKEGMTVTGDVTFEAAFTENTRSYTIVFNDGKTNVYSESLEYGTTITAPTAIPEKESTAKFDYVFSEWTGFKEGMTVTGDVTFEAAFTENTRSYTITIADGITVKDGETEIASGTLVAYDTVLTVTADPKTGYTSVVLANGDDVVDETHTVEGAVTFSVIRTFNLDKLGDFIENEDTPKIEISKDAAGELTNVEFEKLGNKTLVIDVVEDGKILYSWTLEGEYESSKAGTFKASIVAEEPEGKLKDVIETSKVKNPLVLKFSAEGELPKNATVKYYVGDDFDEGTTLTLFFYNEEGNGLDRIASDLIVDENGYVEFSPPHFSQYVLAEMDSESGGAGSNTLLYVGVGIIVAIIAFIAVVALRRP